MEHNFTGLGWSMTFSEKCLDVCFAVAKHQFDINFPGKPVNESKSADQENPCTSKIINLDS